MFRGEVRMDGTDTFVKDNPDCQELQEMNCKPANMS